MKTIHCQSSVDSLDLSIRDAVETQQSKRWKVMPCPVNAGKHPFHDYRWIATEDAEIEFGHDPRSWGLSSGSLICEMRDGPPSNARLIAAAPELLAALLLTYEAMIDCPEFSKEFTGKNGWTFIPAGKVRAAIAKATGGAL